MSEKPPESRKKKASDPLIDFIRSIDPRVRFEPEEMVVPMPAAIKDDSFVIPFSPADEAGAWRATFDWQGAQTAMFQMEMIPGQSLFQDAPLDGWVSWTGEGTLVAWADSESSSHGWAYFAESPMKTDPTESVKENNTDPYWWQALARLCWLGWADRATESQQW